MYVTLLITVNIKDVYVSLVVFCLLQLNLNSLDNSFIHNREHSVHLQYVYFNFLKFCSWGNNNVMSSQRK